ncbi:MAG: DMT family transporter [Rhodobacteraceae bacterium]|nr:DMT family transporter [Paracoccaceae bacterium]
MIRSTSHNAHAALLTILASGFAAGTTLLAKMLGTDTLGPSLHPLQISHGRFMFAFMAIATVTTLLRMPISRPDLRFHAARSAFGWGGVTLMFAAAAFIPLSDATAISFLNPVFGMILAVVFLSERVGPVRWSAAAVAIVGALILLRPTPSSFQPAALLALGAALMLGCELIFIKILTHREKPLQILLINNLIGLLIASAAASFVWHSPTAPQWVALAGIGFLMAAAQYSFTNAMMRGDASFVAPFFYATLIFAALYDFAAFGVAPDQLSLIGMATILSGGGLLAWREARLKT